MEVDILASRVPSFWLLKTRLTYAEGTGELLSSAGLPHLTLITRLCVGVKVTCCETE